MATTEHELDPLWASPIEILLSLVVIAVPIAVLVVVFLLLRRLTRRNETDASG